MIEVQKLGIYRDVIQYFLDFTGLSVKEFAQLFEFPAEDICAIYHHYRFPKNSAVCVDLLATFTAAIQLEQESKQYYLKH